MNNKKEIIKKILTVLTCFVLAVSIISLGSLAYFKENTNITSHSFTFAKVDVNLNNANFSNDSRYTSMNIQDKNINGVYLPISDTTLGASIDYAPTVTNNGEKEIFAYLIVERPIVNETFYLNLFNNAKCIECNEDWVYIDTLAVNNSGINTHSAFVYGYKKLLAPGETTSPLCSSLNLKPFKNKLASINTSDFVANLNTYGLGLAFTPTTVQYSINSNIFNDYYLNNETIPSEDMEDWLSAALKESFKFEYLAGILQGIE